MPLSIAEEIPMSVFNESFLLVIVEAEPDGDVESTVDLHHHLQSQLAAGACASYLLVGELFR